MRFAEALEQGLVPEFGKPEKVVVTHISRIYLFAGRVLKIYNHEIAFFADLATFESRKAFYSEDFFYNNTAAPEIYLHLWGVQERNGAFTLVPPNMGEDFVIEMSRIDDSQTLTKLLINNSLTKDQAGLFVDSLVDTLAVLTKERRDPLRGLFDKGLYEIIKGNTKSLHEWMLGIPENIPKEQSDKVFDLLSQGLEKEPYFKNALAKDLAAAIDNNCDNLLLLNGRPSFIDIMPSMVVWRVVDEYATVSRVIIDLEVLGNQELGEAARAAYAKYQRGIPPIARLMHELRAACIQWPYRYMLKQDNLAKKYSEHAQKTMIELETLLKAK